MTQTTSQSAIHATRHPATAATDVAVFYRQPAVADARPVRLRLCRDGRNAVQGIVALVVSGHVVGLGLPFYLPQTHDLPHYGRTTDIRARGDYPEQRLRGTIPGGGFRRAEQPAATALRAENRERPFRRPHHAPA